MEKVTRREALAKVAAGGAGLALLSVGGVAAKYVDAFMQNVNWEEVERRFGGARRMAALL